MNVGEFMEKSSRTVAITDDVESALELMRAEGLKAIPVVGTDGEVAGLLWYSSIEKISSDNTLDEALEETFPASDPISPA